MFDILMYEILVINIIYIVDNYIVCNIYNNLIIETGLNYGTDFIIRII